MNKYHIGIAGAGIAGLIAGRELLRAGHTVSLFEGRPRTGGRIHSLEVNGYVVETGPEFIHGKLRETLGLLKEYGIPYVLTEGIMYRSGGTGFTVSYDIVEGWDLLLNKMKTLEEDLPFSDFLSKEFPEERFRLLRNSAIRFAEGFDLADTTTASTKALFAEWEHEEAEQYRVPGGYQTLTHAIENEFRKRGGKIYLNHPLNRVDWNSNQILLSGGNNKFIVDKLIVTLPLSLLNQSGLLSESISFSPSIDEKLDAFRQIGYGTVIKIVLIFRTDFWKSMIPDALFIFSDRYLPTWWTQHPLDIPILTAWLGGPRAAALAGQPESFFLDKAMETLSGIFSVSPEEIKNNLTGFRIFNWKNDPWTKGAYSFALPGYAGTKKIYREPIGGRIYFSGEASYDGPHPGTVEAAVVSGLTTAQRLLSDLGQ
jgi:monoamine oxidase